MTSRYEFRKRVYNKNFLYNKVLKTKDLLHIHQFVTPIFTYPDTKQIRNLTIISHIWRFSDKYYKLANKYYGSSKYWWLIAWFNKKPTEAHIEIGDTIYIPTPFELALRYYKAR